MIEHLDGLHETIHYRENTHLKIYLNNQAVNYPPHWHSPIELIMPVENIYTATINDVAYVVNPGEILFIGPYTLHTLEAPPTGSRYLVQADTSILKDIYGINRILSFIGPVRIFTEDNSPEIIESIRTLYLEICNEFFRSSDIYVPPSMRQQKSKLIGENNLCEAAIYSKLIAILTLIGRYHLEQTDTLSQGQSKHQEYISKFMNTCEYIDEHCSENLTLEEVAAHVGFSKFHFSRLFKEFTGMPFYKYVNQKRIMHAESLLRNPDISITEVGLQSGFSSPSAFIRMFKNINGCTPTDFRALHR